MPISRLPYVSGIPCTDAKMERICATVSAYCLSSLWVVRWASLTVAYASKCLRRRGDGSSVVEDMKDK